jgi:hypothetical protein
MAILVLTGIQRADGQNYGGTLAVANFNGILEQKYSTSEIVVGSPNEGNGYIYVYVKNSSGNWVVYRKAATDFGGPAGANYSGFGTSFAVGDFNGDGNMDLAVGCPYENADGKSYVGAVYILYGANNGVGAWPFGSFRRISADDAYSYPINGTQASGEFGFSLAAGDFNGNGTTNLAIGAPGTTISGFGSAGAVYVFHKVVPTGSLSVYEYTYYPGGPYGPNVGSVGQNYEFGYSLTAGNFNGKYFGTFGDGGQQGIAVTGLAVGSPYASVGSVSTAGNVTVMYGGAAYLNDSSAQAAQLWTENNTGGTAKANEYFGISLCGGSFSRNINLWYDSLAIGIPYATVSNQASAGEVRVLNGSSTGLSASGSQLFYPGAKVGGYTFAMGVAPQAYANFGYAMAAGDVFNQVNGNCQGSGCEPQELIIGEPDRNAFGFTDNGSAYIIEGVPAIGLSASLNQVLSPDIGSYAYFSQALASGQVGLWNGQNTSTGPNAWDIIAGAPGNTVGNNPWQWSIYFGDQNDVDTTHPYYQKYY